LRAEALGEVIRPNAKRARIPVVEERPGKHRFGSYVIRLEREGVGFAYDVSTSGGALVTAGYDLLSLTEQAALDGITARLSGKANGN